jgi:hypothetical protein
LTVAYFGEYFSKNAAEVNNTGERLAYRPVVAHWDPKRAALDRIQTPKGFAGAMRFAALRVSPSGRHILVATSVTWDSAPKVFWLSRPELGYFRELLRIERPCGWKFPFDIDVAWDGEEQNVYLAVGYTGEGDTENWVLCSYPTDGGRTYTPSTSNVLFSLQNKKKNAQDLQPFVIRRNLQVVGIDKIKNAVLFYRGDTQSYWSFGLNNGALHEEFPTPFAKWNGKEVRFNEEFATTWTWRDAEMLAVVRKRQDEMQVFVMNPRDPKAARQVARGNIRDWYVQWANRDWLAYRSSDSSRVGVGPWPNVTAVNVRTGEQKVLVTKAMLAVR